jgi:hypothetical protein
VLDLIAFYAIPLKEKWVTPEMFGRLTSGFPTNRDLVALHQADFGPPSWPLHRGNFDDLTWQALAFERPEQFPFWLLEPEILAEVKVFDADPESAVFRAVQRLDILVRQLGSYEPRLVGEGLINQAMGRDGAYAPHGATEAEVLAWANLFRRAVGALKYPQSHRDVNLSRQDAAGQIITVNLLVRKLKQDFPEKFRETEDHEDKTADTEMFEE